MNDFDTLWRELIRTALEVGDVVAPRGQLTRELTNITLRLWPVKAGFVLNNAVRAFNPRYGAAEALWYLGGQSNVDMLLRYAPSYSRFTEADGRAYGAYGPRLQVVMPEVIKTLRRDPVSRRAVAAIWRQGDVFEQEAKDLPCTIAWQFFVRNGAVDMHVYMRSNDLWLGMPNDVFANICCMRLVAGSLGLPVGKYCHHAVSLHLYEKDIPKACEALGTFESSILPPWGAFENGKWPGKNVSDSHMLVDLWNLYNGQDIHPFKEALKRVDSRRR